MDNPLNYQSAGMRELVTTFGVENVETALIFIRGVCDSRGLKVRIQPTEVMIRTLLEAVLGRPDPGWHRAVSINLT